LEASLKPRISAVLAAAFRLPIDNVVFITLRKVRHDAVADIEGKELDAAYCGPLPCFGDQLWENGNAGNSVRDERGTNH
jgi:hypothetical protein